jgi:hypothetical protein
MAVDINAIAIAIAYRSTCEQPNRMKRKKRKKERKNKKRKKE